MISPDEPHREPLLIELVHAEMEFRLKAGEAARVEEYLRKFPQLARDRSTVLGADQDRVVVPSSTRAQLSLDAIANGSPHSGKNWRGAVPMPRPSTLTSLRVRTSPRPWPTSSCRCLDAWENSS